MKQGHHMYKCIYILFLIALLSCDCSKDKKKSNPADPVYNQAIAVWAYPDGASIPYRDDSNSIIAGSANTGVVAYHATGIIKVDFSINGGAVTSVTAETMNQETGEFEYVFQLDPASLSSDGEYIISATAFPKEGDATELPNLKIRKDTAAHDILTVGSGGTYSTLDAACKAAEGGDIIKIVADGAYDLPDQTGYGFTKYVTIMPDTGVAAQIRGGSLRSSYIKFKDLAFDLSTSATDAVISSEYTHFWFDNCIFTGFGRDEPANNASAVRLYNDSEYAVIENSEFSEMSLAATLSAGNYIVRNNFVHHVTADGFGYNGSNILITGNLIHDNHLPPGGDQHCDFISSNEGADQVILRNNTAYNGDHQGIKLGGYNDGRYQLYSNIAVINNQFALGANGSVNVRLEGTAKGKHFTNVMIEYNTIWNGSSIFIIESDVAATNIYFRNNIVGPKEVADMFVYSDLEIDYNCYNLSPSTGANSVVGDPQFADELAWDFTLDSSSPCIGKADTSSGILYDIGFSPRGTIPDMGAYEYP